MRGISIVGMLLACFISPLAQEKPALPALIPPPPERWVMSLDLSGATFAQPAPEEPFGGWFIPVRGLSEILGKPPSTDTLIGVILVGPKLAFLYFKVDMRDIAHLTAKLPPETYTHLPPPPEMDTWFTAQAKWPAFARGVAGTVRFIIVYPPTLKKPPWWPDDIEFGHKPDCTWYGKLSWLSPS